MLITVEGTTNTTLQGAVTVKAEGAHITALDSTATFDPDWNNIPVDKSTFIQTINGVSPDSKGNLFLFGSECDSWGYIVGGTATDAGYKDGEGNPLPDPVVVTSGSTYSKSGIWLVDLCPACSACEMLYRLKQEVIRMKLWLAVLRDVNLYQQHLNEPEHHSDRTELTEANWLWNRRFLPDKYIQCGKYILADEEEPTSFEAYAEDEQFSKGLQLIQQYMTTVHMWNYLVNRNNKSDVISIAPEDTAGFVVQTKRAVTSCNQEQTIQCKVEILHCNAVDDNGVIEGCYVDPPSPIELADSIWFGNRDAVDAPYPVSVLIPRAEVEFIPFEHESDTITPDQAIVGVPAITIDEQTGARSNMWINTESGGSPAYCRWVRTKSIDDPYSATLNVVAAGTYAVTVKFLPFIDSVMQDAEGKPISLRGTTASAVEGKPQQDGSVVFQFFAKDSDPKYLENPSTDQYIDAKTAPTVSVSYKLLWTIRIIWAVTDGHGNVNEETNTYQYLCNGVRRYYSSSVIDGSTLSTAGLEPETTNA